MAFRMEHRARRPDATRGPRPHAATLQVSTAKAPYRVTGTTVSDVKSLFQSQLTEYDYEVEDAWVEGRIPHDLRGTYLRNGPGLQVDGYRHTFDGDGQVLAFAFEGGRCHFRNRFVRTQSFVEEQAAGRPLYRGAFTRGAADGSLLFNPFDFTLKNAANTGVLHWGDRVYAMYESGLPHALEPSTLDTLGPSDMGGQLQTPVLAAHYRVERRPDGSRRWVAFSVNTSFAGARVQLYEFDEAGKAVATTSHPLEGVSMALVHDALVTPDYYLVLVGPLEFSGTKFATEYLFSRCSIAECLIVREDLPTRVHLIPRPDGAAAGTQPRVLDAPVGFAFHHANAYQISAEGRPHLVVDTTPSDHISFDVDQFTLQPEWYDGGSRTHLRRLVFDLTSGKLVGSHQLAQRTMEFPSVNWDMHGKPHTHIFSVGDIVDHPRFWGPAQAVVKTTVDPLAGVGRPFDMASDVALDVWSPGERCIVNEPLFVPRPGATAEDDGWLLVTVHNAATGKGDLVILDARQPSQGPLATVHCPHFLPAGLHGSFTDSVLGRTSEAAPKWSAREAARPLSV